MANESGNGVERSMDSFSPNSHPVSKKETVQQRENSLIYQAVEKRDPLLRLWSRRRRDFILRHCGVRVVRLIPQDSGALHLIVFEQPVRNAVLQRAAIPSIYSQPPSVSASGSRIQGCPTKRRPPISWNPSHGFSSSFTPHPARRFSLSAGRPAGILKQNVGCPGIPRNSDSGLTGG